MIQMLPSQVHIPFSAVGQNLNKAIVPDTKLPSGWLRFGHFVSSVYSPGLHFGFALAWCFALEGSLMSVSQGGNNRTTWRPNWGSCLETVSLFLVLFFLRGVDEWKDFEYDKKQNPDRPLVTGKTTFLDLYLYLFGTGILVLVLNLPLITGRSWLPFLILAADMFYGLLLIAIESKSAILRENVVLNLIITYPVNIVLSIYIYFRTAEFPILDSERSGIPILGAFILAFLNYEFSRKICWPQHAPAGKRLYSSSLGAWGSASASLAFACAAAGIMTYEFVSLSGTGAAMWTAFFPLVSLVPIFLGSWRFFQVRTSMSAPKQSAVLAPTAMVFLILFYVTLIICSLSPRSSHAEDKITSSVAWINEGTWNVPTDTTQDQKTSNALLEIRPDLKATGSRLTAVVRPRLTFSVSNDGSTPSARAQEAFLLWDIFGDAQNSISLTYGLQNYQWGPTESASPSNRIFHETAQSRDFFYEVRGRHIARFNFSWTSQWTTVIMTELTNNGGNPFIAEQTFVPSALAKTELNWNSGVDSIGIVLGGKPRGASWVGEYFNFNLTDAVSIYGDVSHQLGSQAWYPTLDATTSLVRTAPGIRFEQKLQGSSALLTYTVVGSRYAFENGADFRVELILNQAGYTSDDWKLIRSGINYLDQGRLGANGLEFPGQKFFYSSLRIPDLFGKKDLGFYTRYLLSATDRSGGLYLGADYAIGQSGTLFGTLLATHGGPQTELHNLLSGAFSAGYRQIW